MADFALYNENTGEVIGWYDDAVHSVIPDPNVEVPHQDKVDAIKVLEDGAQMPIIENGLLKVVARPAYIPAMDEVRLRRNSLLRASDYTQTQDYPVMSGQQQAWVEYRQKLRDIPQDFPNPQDVVWPEAP